MLLSLPASDSSSRASPPVLCVSSTSSSLSLSSLFSGSEELLEESEEDSASSSCYGIPKKYPTLETTVIDPRYPYALTKYQGEQIIQHWSKIYGIPYISLRFFNVYGPRSRTSGTYGAVFGVFLAQKIAHKPFTVVGDGTQTRDFTFVSDVIRALYLSANSKIYNEIFIVITLYDK